MLSHFSCVLLCNPLDHSPLGSSVHGILQARILEWVAMPFSRGSSRPRDQTCDSYFSCVGRQVLYHWHYLGSPVNIFIALPYYYKYHIVLKLLIDIILLLLIEAS